MPDRCGPANDVREALGLRLAMTKDEELPIDETEDARDDAERGS
jgi:hypothetical protein